MTSAAYTLHSPPPALSTEQARVLACDRFGIGGRARELDAERDQNFRLDADDGFTYVLKVSNVDVLPLSVEFQIRALDHIARTDPSLPVPRVQRTPQGQDSVWWTSPGGERHLVRMLSWVEGEFVRVSDAPDKVKTRMGRFLARLGKALEGFDHPGSLRDLPWDLSNTLNLRGLRTLIDKPDLLKLVNRKLDHFEVELLPRLSGLRRQVIHNDFNPDNVLITATAPFQVTGVIDFGDMVEAPLICDLAVGCSYQLTTGPDPVADMLPMIAGYHQVTSLLSEETDLLCSLVECRLMASLLIPAWRAQAHPKNREYLLGDSPTVDVKLRNLAALDPDETVARIRQACQAKGQMQ